MNGKMGGWWIDRKAGTLIEIQTGVRLADHSTPALLEDLTLIGWPCSQMHRFLTLMSKEILETKNIMGCTSSCPMSSVKEPGCS